MPFRIAQYKKGGTSLYARVASLGSAPLHLRGCHRNRKGMRTLRSLFFLLLHEKKVLWIQDRFQGGSDKYPQRTFLCRNKDFHKLLPLSFPLRYFSNWKKWDVSFELSSLSFTTKSTLLSSCRAGHLTYSHVFLSRLSPLNDEAVLYAYTFASNWQLLFLNQWKGENDRRNDFMIILQESYVAELGSNLCSDVLPTALWNPA